jgi:hypothetical protein
MAKVDIPSGTTVGSIETMGHQWVIMIGYNGQRDFVLKSREIYPFGDWENIGEFDLWREAHDKMLNCYNQYNDHA